MKKRLVLVRHNHNPPEDRIASWAYFNGYQIDQRFPFAGDELPKSVHEDNDLGELAGTIIYGGPFNASETNKHAFLLEEYRWMETCMQADIPLLGICQGAQQIAHQLGYWAGLPEKLEYEFGYYELKPSADSMQEGFLEAPMFVAQSHFHTFDLPKGAVHLASSAAYENQAFRIGSKVYGFQFHAEQTVENFRRWQDLKVSTYGLPGAQSRDQQNQLMALHDEPQGKWFYAFLDKLFGPAQ